MAQFSKMAAIIPEGVSGRASIEHFEVDADASRFTSLRQVLNPSRDEFVSKGTYVRLCVDGQLVMTDTRMEQRTNRAAVHAARGDVLIGGLGIGLIVLPIARKPDVRSVTVIEKSADVVQLVEEPLQRALTGLQSAGLVVFVGDVATWHPRQENIHQFDYIYLDIWSDICSDDYAEHLALRARYRKFLRRGGHVDSWQFARVRAIRQRDGGRW